MTPETPSTGVLHLPPDRTELLALRNACIGRRLGYAGDRRFVLFGYSPGGGDVFWKDGHSSGFSGRWQLFLEEVAPLGLPHHIDLGGIEHVGTHVLLVDLAGGACYAVPRASAEEFLALLDGRRPPVRLCMCAWTDECPPARGSDGRSKPSGPHPHRLER